MQFTFDTRKFIRIMAVFAILDATILMVGCGDWETQAINVIGLVGPAIQAIIAILAALGVKVPATVMTAFTKWSGEAVTDLQTIKSLIQQVKDADAAAQPALLAQIQAAVGVLAQNLATVLPELHIDDPTDQARVAAAFAAIQGFLGELAALIPIIKPTMTLGEARKAHVELKAATDKFRVDFNTAVAPYGSQYEI